jgi:hypothetical protein
VSLLFLWNLTWAQGLVVDVLPSKGNEVIQCTVRIDRAPNAVSALGFEVVYDPAIWRYSDHFSAGVYAKHLSFFNAHEATPGRIRIGGGAMSSQIESGSSGALLTLDFRVLQPGAPNIRVENLVDHVAGWPIHLGTPGEPPRRINSPQR